MKPRFTICRLGAQDKVPNTDEIIKTSDLTFICQELTMRKDYDVRWQEERIEGKMFTLETETHKYFISYTPKDVGGRNSYLQSVPTAFGRYLEASARESKECQFCLYITTVSHGNNQTPYHLFMYRLLSTIGIRFLNATEGLRGIVVKPYHNVRELIRDRDRNRYKNNANTSSYITDEGSSYHIYGKTFGANQKETTLLCYALCRISEKPIRLFQIIDNEQPRLSEADIQSIKSFAAVSGKSPIDILDDTYRFPESETAEQGQAPCGENLRSPRFVFNLLQKTGGHKCCELCHCEIESIVQGAHIYPISAIRKRADLTYQEKLAFATDKDNGLWLCENHHKLFDDGLIRFDDGVMRTLPRLSQSNAEFVKAISTSSRIKAEYYTEAMRKYFVWRDEFYSSEHRQSPDTVGSVTMYDLSWPSNLKVAEDEL